MWILLRIENTIHQAKRFSDVSIVAQYQDVQRAWMGFEHHAGGYTDPPSCDLAEQLLMYNDIEVECSSLVKYQLMYMPIAIF